MQRYQPPHARQRQAAVGAAPVPSGSSSTSIHGAAYQPAQNQAGPSPSRPPPVSIRGYAHPQPAYQSDRTPRSKRDWSTPVLASPSSDLRPMRASTPGRTELDEMEMMQSVSRSGGDGAEGDALKNWETQEKYRRYIDDRLEKHHATFKRKLNYVPSANASDELQSLKSIVLLLRKLREGVVASHRIDDFAIEVFEASVRLSILARDPAQLISSLSGLVPGLYTAVDDLKGKGKLQSGVAELEDGLAGLALGDSASIGAPPLSLVQRRREFASILLLYHLAHGNSRRTFLSTLTSLTSGQSLHLRSTFDVPLEPTPTSGSTTRLDQTSPSAAPPFATTESLSYAIKVARALSDETFNPFAYFALRSEPTATTYERAVVAWAEVRVRDKALEIMRKAYISCDLQWAAKWVGLAESEAGEWHRSKGLKVDSGRVVLR